jgi:hypothetical protein
MPRHHQHARALLFLLIANLSLWIQVSSLYAAYPHTVGQTWTHCLDTVAKRIQINPVLLCKLPRQGDTAKGELLASS